MMRSFSLCVILAVLLLALFPRSIVWSAGSTTTALTYNPVQPLPGYELQGQASQDLAVLVNIAIPFRNQALLSSMVKQVSDPSSPLFRHFLTPQEIQQDFLPTAAYYSMLNYLQSVGLHVVMEAMDSIIVVQATVAQVNEYLNATVNMYTNGIYSYYLTSGSSLFEGANFIASNATALMAKPDVASLPLSQLDANVTFSEGGLSVKELQDAYNATSLYAQGDQGQGQTIGLLDFYGSPTIIQDLSLFDEQFGLPNTNFTITPIGPYDPNLGVAEGWSTEISLDVEASHAMAPEAAIDMYVASPALTFAADLAAIVEANSVTTLSQSFSAYDEWVYPIGGANLFYFNMFLPDQYFMVGSLEGITFLGASGDGGGSGFSSGPAGNLANPEDSPYVTAVGGTQTYVYAEQNGTERIVQTAWSNLGYVPNGTNTGGGGGGVSFLEPKPWYQQSQLTPPSYPNGRMSPDLSLQAGVDPGIYIVDSGSVIIVGGTSVSVQLLSGLLTLVAESVGGHLGLINPFLYSLGNNPTTYTEAFTPITFGYIIPWTASYGYNLATGWGAPNIGEIASLYNATKAQSSLSISVDLTNSAGGAQEEFTSSQVVYVTANVTSEGAAVTSGEFTASLVTLAGASLPTFMTYNSTDAVWTASLTMGQQSGIAYVDVNGIAAGLSGDGFAEIFAGYLASFLSPMPTAPWTTQSGGIQVVVASTDLNGNPAPLQPLTMQVNSYSILNNLYNPVDTVTLQPVYIPSVGNVTAAILTSSYPTGPMNLMLQGSVYGFLPFINGIYLQTTLILPEVAVEPGSVAPGQSLTIIAFPIAPLNVAGTASMETGATVGSDVATGSNVTALLVNPSGATVGEADLVYQSSEIIGYLAVPSTAAPGLYTILLEASYDSVTLGYTLEGSFYGQILVSSGVVTPLITLSPSTLYMGQTAQITADIAYPNGQEVTQGEYTALIYPEELQNIYTAIMYDEYQNGELTPLSYSPTLNRWVGDVTLPSPYNSGVISPVNSNSFYYAGPYDAYVTGLSYDGVPTTSTISAQQGFFIQPYVYMSNQEVTSFQQSWGLALSGVTVVGSANLDEDVFLDSNWFNSSTTIVSDSIVSGTVYVNTSTLTLVGVHGGNVVASNSTVNLVNTNLDSITLVNSQVSLTSSSYQSITPSLPTVQILSPVNGGNYTGTVNGSLDVLGDSIGSVVVCLDGQIIQTFSQNGTLSFTIPSAKYPDGAYSLEAVVTQTDGINSTATSTVYFQNQLSQITSLVNSLNSTRTSLQNQITSLMNSLNTANDYAYAGIGIGLVATVIAILTLLRKRSKSSPHEEPKSPESPQENSEEDLTLREGSVT